MINLSVEDKIKVLEQLYVKEKNIAKKMLILYQIKKYKELINVKYQI